MGESACLMQPFSYTAGIPNEAKEGNPVHALGQSISFGRFMSESLAWEKWSTFSHNKYVEEAERYTRPGSVAQKKAFFEAHYKTLAARKAAALLEQANAAANNATESEAGGRARHTMNSNSQMAAPDQQVKASSTETGSIYDSQENNSDFVKFDSSKVEGADSVAEHNVLLENNLKNEYFEKNGVVDKAEIRDVKHREATQVKNYVKVEKSRKVGEAIELELSEGSQMEKPLLKSASTNQDELEVTSKKKPPHSSSKMSAYARTSKVPSSPAKFTAPIRPNKGNNHTPVAKKSAMDISDRKRSTPKSSHKSINFTPAKEFCKVTTTIIQNQKIDGSRIASNSKASKECPTPLRTPNTVPFFSATSLLCLIFQLGMAVLVMDAKLGFIYVLQASTSGRPKQSSATPWSENRSARTPVNSSASVSKTARGKWHFLPTDCSKFLSACRKKSQSPGIFASFSLRTEERAARRKQRLEEKFNVSQEQKVQQQTTLKEKAETELKKLSQSFCFKARPLPDFYKERRTTKDQMQKVPLTQAESPALGRKSTPSKASAAQSKNSLPYRKSSIKNICFEHVQEKKNQISVRSLTPRVAMTDHENTSPNIQHA
ncbi:protein WVD2-like 7 isoform X1 [Durio zibethinus]|uniref:Protein WVD2-like 7 isoform X1 n=1 Tax=Durio zibethinus TaxID=66656 RepID=A0A6P6BB42_DURZI|nr:protein WVD2-like 7 isoform X1 [Durio zibethinus]